MQRTIKAEFWKSKILFYNIHNLIGLGQQSHRKFFNNGKKMDHAGRREKVVDPTAPALSFRSA